MRRIIILLSVITFGVLGILFISNAPEIFTEIKPAVSEIPLNESITLEKAILFSHEDSFYAEEIEVELSANYSGENEYDTTIYYTIDGSDPTTDSLLYTEPIKIRATKKVRATTIKAIAVNINDSEENYSKNISDIVTKSYITGTDVFDRFSSNTLVFVLSTDPYNLYDYYYGIAIEGFLRDEYINSDEYKGGEINPPRPANYNMRGIESERDMYVEVFDNLGVKLIDQAAGGRVVGGWSRASSQKSFRLFARNIYSEGNGMFKYPFFTDAVDASGQPILKYDRITLRNGGNDREQAGIRDELSLELAKQAGFPDTMEARPVAIFLNGRYYGFSWLKEAYCNGYLEQTYGGIKDNYQIISNSEEGDEGEEFAANDYAQVYNLALKAVENTNNKTSFKNDEVFEEFCSKIDIDNLLLYYAIEVYIDNHDWPGNNVKLWRYYPSEGEAVTDEYHDGKWRFMLFDAEFGWGLYGNGYYANTLEYILSDTGRHMGGYSVLLTAVLQREDMREKFANITCDLISGTFSSKNVQDTLANLISQCYSEQNYALDNGLMDWASRWTFFDNREQITEFAIMRPALMKNYLKSTFDIPQDSKFYKVKVIGAEGAEIRLNSQKTSENGKSLSGEYFDVYEVEISATAFIGYEFDYWEIGEDKYYENELKISASKCDDNNSVTAKLYLKKATAGMPLVVSEIHAEGKEDWIELYNPNSVSVSTRDYYLTDDPEIPLRWKIPAVNIPSETAIVITMKNNKSINSLYKLQADFNLKEGEILVLSDENGVVHQKTLILASNKDESMIRQIDGTYKVLPSTPLEYLN